MLIPERRKNDDAVLFRTRLKSLSPSVVSSSTMSVASLHDAAGVPAQVPAPITERDLLPDGTFRVTFAVQWQVPAGIFTIVVEAATALNAFCTSVCEQLAALMACARAFRPQRATNKEVQRSIFSILITRTPAFEGDRISTVKYPPVTTAKSTVPMASIGIGYQPSSSVRVNSLELLESWTLGHTSFRRPQNGIRRDENRGFQHALHSLARGANS
jgi:hypothetical protein